MQILDQTLSRMRYSTQGRILAELALVQNQPAGGPRRVDGGDRPIAVGRWPRQRRQRPSGTGHGRPPPPAAVKKKYEPAVALPDSRARCESGSACHPWGATTAAPQAERTTATTTELSAKTPWIWNQLSRLSGMMVDQARHFDSVAFPRRIGWSFGSSQGMLLQERVRAARAGRPIRAGAWRSDRAADSRRVCPGGGEPERNSPRRGSFRPTSGCWKRRSIRWSAGPASCSGPAGSEVTIHCNAIRKYYPEERENRLVFKGLANLGA